MDGAKRTMGEWALAFCDLILLDLLWLVCSLPVVTVGASTAALHSVVRKMVSNEPYTVWAGFWQGFRENWKQGTLVSLILGLLFLVSGADLMIGLANPGPVGLACKLIGVLGCVGAVFTLSLAFPLLVRYRLPLGLLLKNALLLSLMNPHVVLLGLAAAAVFPVLGTLHIYLRIIATPGWVLLGGGLPVLVQQLLMQRVYARLEAGQTMEGSNYGDGKTETHL